MSDWDRERATVLRLTDPSGRGVDPGVVDVVVGLRLSGFATAGSCWGHTARACNGPWVHLAPDGEEGFEGLRGRVEALLGGLDQRHVAPHRRLTASTLLDHETLEPAIVRVQTVATFETSRGKRPRDRNDLRAARRRMTALAEHLRSRLPVGRPPHDGVGPPAGVAR